MAGTGTVAAKGQTQGSQLGNRGPVSLEDFYMVLGTWEGAKKMILDL